MRGDGNPYSLTSHQLDLLRREGINPWQYCTISSVGGNRLVMVVQKLILMTTFCRFDKPNMEIYSLEPDFDQLNESLAKFYDIWTSPNPLRATLLIFLGKDIESGHTQYFIAKEYASQGAKESCIRRLEQYFCQPIQVSSEMTVNSLRYMSGWQRCFNGGKTFVDVMKGKIDKQFFTPGNPTKESSIKASGVCPREEATEVSFSLVHYKSSLKDLEEGASGIKNNCNRFLQGAKELSNKTCNGQPETYNGQPETYNGQPETCNGQAETCNGQAETTRRRKGFVCCGGRPTRES